MDKFTGVIKKSALAPTVLVAGGAGFIGSHLVEALLLKDVKVVALDNFSTGKKSYLNSVLENPKFVLIEADINDGIPQSIESVDYIFHLAGLESYIYREDVVTLDSLLTSAVGTKNLLDLAKRSMSKFLLASSFDVYEGMVSSIDLGHYFGHTDNEEKKYSHSEAKRFAEALVWEYYKKNKINSRIVRLPEVYGPRMDFSSGSELGRLLKLLLDHNDLTIFGDGLEKNYYLFIADAIAGLVKALFGEESDGKIYSLYQSDPITTLELTYLVKGLSDSQTHVTFKNQTQKIKSKELNLPGPESFKDLKWSPKIELKEGIIKTLKWNGYEFNQNPFKPAKFLAREEQQDKQKKEAVTTINTQTEVKEDLSEKSFIRSFLQLPKISIPRFQIPKLSFKPRISKPQRVVSKQSSDKQAAGTKQKTPRAASSFPKLIVTGAILSIFSAILFFAILPVVQTYYYTNKGYSYLLSAQQSMTNLNITEAQVKGSMALTNFGKAKAKLSEVGWIFVISKQEERLRSYAKLLKIAEYASSAVTNSAIGVKPLLAFWEGVKPNSPQEVNKDQIVQAGLNFRSAKEDVSRAQAEFNSINSKYIPTKLWSKLSEIADKIPYALETLQTAQTLTDGATDVIGIGSKKKYLTLFQNPNELRATGGFIGSYAVVNLENGKIKEISIDDVYNIDGLLDLNNYKEPSIPAVKKYLKQDYLRIRDANWNPSFPDSANQVLKLFNEANGSKFDGVIAIDMFLVKDLLSATGPLFLTSYNEEITADNVYERAQYYSEARYLEGSQQKKEFLTVLGSKLMETLFSMGNEKLSPLVKAVFLNLERKHILLYIPNSQISALISDKNWDGKVNPTKTDFLYIVDSNVGANKADYFINREAEYEIKNTYRDGALEVNLTLTYKHTGKDLTWPGGPYTDYVRVLVPKESFLHKATATTSSLAQNPPSSSPETEITKDAVVSETADKRVFEIPFILQPQETIKLNFNYTLPSNLALNKGESVYSLIWQKQPGTQGMPIKVTFNQPFGRKVTSTNPTFTQKIEGVLVYTKTLEKDIFTSVVLK